MSNKKLIIAIISIVVILGLAITGIAVALSSQDNDSDDSKKTVVTTLFPYYSLVDELTDDSTEVILIGEGNADPHSFEPTAKDILTITQADAVVINGGIDEWVVDTLANEGVSEDILFEAISAIPEAELLEPGEEHHDHSDEHGKDEEHSDDEDHSHEEDEEHSDEEKDKDEDHEEGEEHDHDDEMKKDGDNHDHHNHGDFDPHIWLSPTRMSSVEQPLISFLEDKDIATQSTDKITKLADDYKNTLSSCELNQMVTSHEAFNYLAEDYNLEIKGIQGLSTETNPSPQELNELLEFITDNNIEYVTLEENSNRDFVQTLANEAGVDTLDLATMEIISDFTSKSYFDIMDDNLDSLSTALKCS